MRLILILLILLPVIGFSQKKETKKQKFYREYWEQEAQKEKYDVIFKEADQLFASEKFYLAIEKYQSLFELMPNDQQAIARIKDVEIILASLSLNKPDTARTERVFIPLDKLKLKSSIKTDEVKITQSLKGDIQEEKPIIKDKIEAKPESINKMPKEVITAPKIAVQQPELKKEDNTKPIEELRKEIATNYQDGFTEEVYQKANRKITKRVLVKNGLGDEYQKVEHAWGGKFYFKNGEPITQFIWEKETEVERP